MNSGRFLDGPGNQVFHDHGNEENISTGSISKFSIRTPSTSTSALRGPGSKRPILMMRRTRQPGPDSWLIAADSALTGNPSDPRIRNHKSERLTSLRLDFGILNPNTVLTFGGYARQDQYNYYPSANPFADLTPDLQSATTVRIAV